MTNIMRRTLQVASGGMLSLCTTVGWAQSFSVLPETPVVSRGAPAAQQKTTRGKSPRELLTTLIALELKDVSLEQALREIGRKSGVRMAFGEEILQSRVRISLTRSRISVSEALQDVLRGTGITYQLRPTGQLVFVPTSSAQRRDTTYTIQGRIIDSADERGIANVTVTIVGTRFGTVTQENGTFRIPGVSAGAHTLSAKLLGYKSKTFSITVDREKSAPVLIALTRTSTSLAGVVTTATGQQRKVEVGNDITKINVEEVLRDYPVTTMSDLLANRVPGLVATPTSGQPGAPTRIRIHGVSTLSGSNDPIIIVDGVQVDSRSVADNPARYGSSSPTGVGFHLSPLDRIDPNSIATVEVLKGPAAVALYGSDAGNGVIVITTKKGEVGQTRWNFSTAWGTTTIPGKWPVNYYGWGKSFFDGRAALCKDNPGGLLDYCQYDSTSTGQILNDPFTTTMGHGSTQRISASVYGGSKTTRYALTISLDNDRGIVKLPDKDVQLLEEAGESVPGWVRNPDASNGQNGTVRLDLAPAQSVDIALTTTLGRRAVRSSPLSQVINKAYNLKPPVPIYDSGRVVLPGGTGLLQQIPNFRERRWTNNLSSLNTLSFDIRVPHNVFSSFTAGVERSIEDARTFIARGAFYRDRGSSREPDVGSDATERTAKSTAQIRGTVRATPLQNAYLTLQVLAGSDYLTGANDLVRTMGNDFPIGAVSGNGGAIKTFSSVSDDRRSMGAFAELRVGIANRLWLPFGVRSDAASTLGASIRPKLPKLGFSYLLSEQPVFQRIPLLQKIPELRVRAAFGVSGRQPAPGKTTRTYIMRNELWESNSVPTIGVNDIGNTKLRPERVQEYEWGLDGELLKADWGRFSVTATWTRKMTTDLLSNVPVPLSVGSRFDQLVNIGDLRNTAFDGSIDAMITGRALTWNPVVRVTSLRNKLVRIGDEQLSGGGVGMDGTAFEVLRVGYPVYSRWARPIVGFADLNGDDYISQDEVVWGDSAVYLGAPLPRFELVLDNRITFLSNFTVTGLIKYRDGMAQVRDTRDFERVFNDPKLPLAEQAYGRYSDLARVQVVSSLRFETFQFTYVLPRAITHRWFPGRTMTVSLQGQNLGLWTDYKGMDPNVGASGESIQDKGQIPTPRTWGFSIRIL